MPSPCPQAPSCAALLGGLGMWWEDFCRRPTHTHTPSAQRGLLVRARENEPWSLKSRYRLCLSALTTERAGLAHLEPLLSWQVVGNPPTSPCHPPHRMIGGPESAVPEPVESLTLRAGAQEI